MCTCMDIIIILYIIIHYYYTDIRNTYTAIANNYNFFIFYNS